MYKVVGERGLKAQRCNHLLTRTLMESIFYFAWVFLQMKMNFKKRKSSNEAERHRPTPPAFFAKKLN